MKIAAILAVLAATAAAQTPDISAIMERVGKNQEQAQDLRKQYTFRQKQLLRMHRGNGKVAREEHREYECLPGRARRRQGTRALRRPVRVQG